MAPGPNNNKILATLKTSMEDDIEICKNYNEEDVAYNSDKQLSTPLLNIYPIISVELNVGEQIQLKSYYSKNGEHPNLHGQEVTKKTIWISSDPSIATITEEGILTKHKRGSATISAQYEGLISTIEAKTDYTKAFIKIDLTIWFIALFGIIIPLPHIVKILCYTVVFSGIMFWFLILHSPILYIPSQVVFQSVQRNIFRLSAFLSQTSPYLRSANNNSNSRKNGRCF